MGLWDRFKTSIATRVQAAIESRLEKRFHPLQTPITTSWLMSGAVSDTGQNVTPDTAMAAAAVYACVSVIASTLSTLPIGVYGKKSKESIDDHPVSILLNETPNSEMTACSFREANAVNALLWGNGYTFVEKDGPFPVGLWPLRAASTTPYRQAGKNDLEYHTITGAASYTFSPDQMLHVPDLSYDGIVGMSRTRYASNPIGLALAMEKFGAKFFANGANLGGILELPAGMKKESVDAFVASWKKEYNGAENSLKTAMLTDGMKYTKTGTDPRQAQMVDTRAFQVQEIARIYRVPLHKIGDLSGATNNNIEQQAIEFMQDCIRPWAVKFEQEFNRKLLLEKEKSKFEIRHDLDSLLRADTTARYAAYNTGLQNGFLTRNEVRAKENLAPIDGGDVPLQPLNMGNPGGDPNNKPPTVKPEENPKGNQP